MDLGRLVLGSPILYLKGMRIMMFQLSGFYCRVLGFPSRVAFTGSIRVHYGFRSWGFWFKVLGLGFYIGFAVQ